jgi:DNA-binding beta-propeller fold protein YncE
VIAVLLCAVTSSPVAVGETAALLEGERLHTGMTVTPTAAPGSVFQALNPGLPDLPDFVAGQAVSTALSPDGRTLLILTSGYNRMNGPTGSRRAEWSNEYVFVYDVSGTTPVKQQALTVPNTFNGITWSPDGQEFYVSGGRDDNVHFYRKTGGVWAEEMPALDLGSHPNVAGNYQPMAAGLAVNQSGDLLVVANMLYDSVTVVNLQNRTLVGEVDLLFVAESNRDSVAVIDTVTDQVLTRINTTAPTSLLTRARRFKGSNPNALALSPDERTLYVTNGGTNSLAVVRLSQGPRRVTGRVSGLISTGYYPNAISVSADGLRLYVVNGMSNTGPNPQACRDTVSLAPGSQNECSAANQYSWQLTKAGFLTLPVPSRSDLASLTQQVAQNCRMRPGLDQLENARVMSAVRRGINHVIYVVKDNRTYDQVFGDLPRGNGDPELAIMSPFSPNHKKLAMDFVLLDNFHDSGTVSGDGWNWSTAGRANDYTQKSVPVNYGGRGFSYDWEGANRNVNVSLPGLAERQAENPSYPNDPNLLPGVADVAAPDSPEGEAGTGYLWDSVLRAGRTIRNYGFYVANLPVASSTFRTPFAAGIPQSAPLNQALAPHTDVYFRGYDQNNADYWLYKGWEREFDAFVANNNLPNLMFVRLPHDHFGNFNTAITASTPWRRRWRTTTTRWACWWRRWPTASTGTTP